MNSADFRSWTEFVDATDQFCGHWLAVSTVYADPSSPSIADAVRLRDDYYHEGVELMYSKGRLPIAEDCWQCYHPPL
jgi:hypothetical protein